MPATLFGVDIRPDDPDRESKPSQVWLSRRRDDDRYEVVMTGRGADLVETLRDLLRRLVDAGRVGDEDSIPIIRAMYRMQFRRKFGHDPR